MKKIWRRIRCFEQPSNAESIGTASSTPISTKDHGRSRKIGNYLSTCWSWKGPRSGQRLPSSWREGLRMHWRIGSTCSSIASARSLATLLRSGCLRFALIDWCLRRASRRGWKCRARLQNHLRKRDRNLWNLHRLKSSRTESRLSLQWVSRIPLTVL